MREAVKTMVGSKRCIIRDVESVQSSLERNFCIEQ